MSHTKGHHEHKHTNSLTEEEALRNKKNKRRNLVRLIVDIIMLISAFLVGVSAFIKLPLNYDRFFTYGQELCSFHAVSALHDYAGIAFIVSLIIHVWLSWKRMVYLIKHHK
jgi:cytochrome b subunit of formate dehydrogenase